MRKVITISTLVVMDAGRMLLVRKEGLDSFILPGGKIDKNENFEQAVRREIREELGCEIEGLAYVRSFRDAAAGADVDVEVHVHIGTLSSKPSPQAEISEIFWCDIRNPEVPVAPSLERQIFDYFKKEIAS